jgi:hypothetical protein
MLKNFVKCTMAGAVLLTTSAFAAPSVIDTATFNGHTYKLLSADTWTASEAFAVSDLAAHLVTVNDAAENAFLISRFGSSEVLWLGLHREAPHSPTFLWADGSTASYRNWAPDEPNDCGACIGDADGEQYTHTYTNGTWNDLGNLAGNAGPKHGVVEISSVPEPGALALLAAGMSVVWFGGRKKSA